jgi:predicted ferric reductase
VNYEDTDVATPRLRPRRRPRGVDGLAALAGICLGAIVAQWWVTKPTVDGGGEMALAIGQLAGLLAAFMAMLGLLLAARVPLLDSTLGLDRLVRIHARLGPWTLLAMLTHVVLITIAYAALAETGALAQFWTIVTTYEWVALAAVGLLLMLIAGFASWWRIRRRLRYEFWWLLHVSMYAGIALAVPHQIANGAIFVGYPVAQWLWLGLYAVILGALLAFRLGLPIARTVRCRPRVADVVAEAPDVTSVIIEGAFARLPLAGGQFAHWRFLTRGLWWQAHPYSISGVLDSGRLRITVRAIGDHSHALRRLRPGTRVLMEGPYGAFTALARQPGRAVALIAAGVGITPIRALLQDLAPDAAPAVIYRARDDDDLIFRDELEQAVRGRDGVLHCLVGDRERHPVTAARLVSLVPDIADRTLYVCGPPGFAAAVLGAAKDLGIPRHRIHAEAFRLHPADAAPRRVEVHA